jgi:putative transposase
MMTRTKKPRKTLPVGVARVLKRLHYSLEVILCVRWHVAYSLSLRDLEEMMVQRGFEVDHSSVHRWAHHRSGRLAMTDRLSRPGDSSA